MKHDRWELKAWLEDRQGPIAHHWRSEIRAREDRRGDGGDGFLGRFLDDLLHFLAACLGSPKDVGEGIWQQATYLYGSLALQRGLAAGEVVEELQLLRTVILRLLLETQPSKLEGQGFRRDLLTLNKALDQGVVRASIAYVDDLFFAHLQGSGVPESLTADVEDEMGRQLETFRKELGKLDLSPPYHEKPHGQG